MNYEDEGKGRKRRKISKSKNMEKQLKTDKKKEIKKM